MKIVFCGKCGVRLSDQDYPGGLDAAPVDADLLCRECSTPTTVQLPVASRDRSSESRIKPARRASASSTQAGVARKSGIQTAPPEEAFVAGHAKDRRRPDASGSPGPSFALPIAGILAAVLVVLGLFLMTRGSSEAPKDSSRVASAPQAKPNAPASARPLTGPPATAMPKTPAPSRPDPSQARSAQKAESSPAHANPPAAPVPASEPAPTQSADAQKSADPVPAPENSKGLETTKVSNLSDSEEEEALAPEKKPVNAAPAKTVDKETSDIGLFKPQNPEAPAPVPPPKTPEPEKKNTEMEQRLKHGEWVSLYTREDRDSWKLDKPDGWKLQGDSLAGSGKLQYSGINLSNYEMKAEVSLSKGASLSVVLRSNDEIAYRVYFNATSVTGQVWDFKQKRVKKSFEKVDVDTKGFQKILVQSKGRWLRVVLNDKDVLLEYDEVPLDTAGFYFSTYKANGAIKNVSLRALF